MDSESKLGKQPGFINKDLKPEFRVLTFTKVWRVETKMTDAEIMRFVKEAYPQRQIDDVQTALEYMAELSWHYGQDPRLKIESHNLQVEERDPGYF